jgi:hypothetical protein
MAAIGARTRGLLKRSALAAGGIAPEPFVAAARKFSGWLEIGRWLRSECVGRPRRMAAREQLFDLIGAEVAEARTLYLEFGVYRGESMRYWSRLLKNPAARLHGFDSFEGLPECWSADHARGHFSTGGELPEIGDPRVEFFKGWFERTLPDYAAPAHDALVVNLDADLYASTRFVLERIAPLIRVGAWLYFDEFSDPSHEFRAFREFVAATGMKFAAVAESRNFWNVVFRRVA